MQTDFLMQRQAGERDGYFGRPPAPFIHWSDDEVSAYCAAYTVGCARRHDDEAGPADRLSA